MAEIPVVVNLEAMFPGLEHQVTDAFYSSCVWVEGHPPPKLGLLSMKVWKELYEFWVGLHGRSQL
jgi:hypothetical protein